MSPLLVSIDLTSHETHFALRMYYQGKCVSEGELERDEYSVAEMNRELGLWRQGWLESIRKGFLESK